MLLTFPLHIIKGTGDLDGCWAMFQGSSLPFSRPKNLMVLLGRIVVEKVNDGREREEIVLTTVLAQHSSKRNVPLHFIKEVFIENTVI